MNAFICTLYLLLFKCTDCFVSPVSSVVSTKGNISPPIPQFQASSSSFEYVSATIQLADEPPVDIVSAIINSVFIYPAGILAVSLVAIALLFVAEKVAVFLEGGGEKKEEAAKKEVTPNKKEKVSVPESIIVETETTDKEQWSD